MIMSKGKIVLAYSGGLDTSVAIKQLNDNYGYDVIAVTVDLGEGKDLEGIKQKALKAGAVSAYTLDVKHEYAYEYLAKALKANVMYENVYPLISALSRPLISKKLVEIAEKLGAVAIAHGCTGKGNDQVRFETSIAALNPSLIVVAPIRDSPMSRESAIEYANKHNIPVSATTKSPYSIDLNLWGRSCECGVLEDPWVAPPEDAHAWTNSIANTPDDATIIEITFEKGIATHLDGKEIEFDQLIQELNIVAGKNGVGRIDHVENRLIGIKSREIYEAPAAITLIKAHQALESLCLTRDVMNFKAEIERKFANLVYDGLWFSPLVESINAFIDNTQQTVNGVVRIKLHKGNLIVIGRKSPQSLYDYNLATYKDDDSFDHSASVGFIKVWSLPLAISAQVNKDYKEG
jgi:argininosuccinate synthase